MLESKNIEAFTRTLQSLWSVEKMLTEAMPAMIEKAGNFGLKKNLAMHLAETDKHKVAIESICKLLDVPHEGEQNQEMKTLLSEGEQLINAASGSADAAIITGAIKVEHYEIEKYHAAANEAEQAGYKGVAQRLRLTMEEERQADAKLHFLEKNYIQQSSLLGAPGLALK